MQKSKTIILTFIHNYLPGFKSGGPVRTIANVVEYLGEEFDFRIVTSDRDFLDVVPYQNIKPDTWIRVGKAHVYYASPQKNGILDWIRLMRDTPHDVLYLNSLFDRRYVLCPLLASRFCGRLSRPIIIAPRGELSPGALAIKWRRKEPFLFLAKKLGLYRNVSWHASTKHEAQLIRQHFGRKNKILVACDLPMKVPGLTNVIRLAGGPLRVVYLSRISRMKNLDYALRVLAKSKVHIQYDIFGILEDVEYWRECQTIIKTLPPNVVVRYCGVADHDDVQTILSRYDLFFLPTRGENYGHVIAESLSAGTPVLIANTTPWRNLEKEGVGWDLPLEDGVDKFVKSIEDASLKNASSRDSWRQLVYKYAVRKLTDPTLLDDNRRVFRDICSRTMF